MIVNSHPYTYIGAKQVNSPHTQLRALTLSEISIMTVNWRCTKYKVSKLDRIKAIFK